MKTKNPYFIGNAKQRKRLKRFIEFLKNLKPDNFNIDVICENKDRLKTSTEALCDLKSGCGTVACVAGHLPVFNNKRFSFGKSSILVKSLLMVYDDIEGKETDSIDDIFSRYFGVTYSICDYILYDNDELYGVEKVTPKIVANRLEKILNGVSPFRKQSDTKLFLEGNL